MTDEIKQMVSEGHEKGALEADEAKDDYTFSISVIRKLRIL